MTPLVARRSVCWTKAELSRLAATLMTPFLKTWVAIISEPEVSCTSQEIPRACSVRPMITCRRKIRLRRSLFCKISSRVSRGIRSNASSVGAKTVKGPPRKGQGENCSIKKRRPSTIKLKSWSTAHTV